MRRDVPIMLVEDDRLDVKTLKRALVENKVTNPLYVVSNGEEALAFLRREPPYVDPVRVPRPGLILLDLNLPILPGLEFLRIYRQDPELASIPAVVLTTSEEERDLVEAYRVGIAGYVRKPLDFETFVEAVRQIDLYWSLCSLP